jgi:hypothetical protein
MFILFNKRKRVVHMVAETKYNNNHNSVGPEHDEKGEQWINLSNKQT